MVLYIQYLLNDIFKDFFLEFKKNNNSITIPDNYDKEKYCKFKCNLYCSFFKCNNSELIECYKSQCFT